LVLLVGLVFLLGLGGISAGLIYALVALCAYLFGSVAAKFICLVLVALGIGLLGLYFFALFEAFSVPIRYEGDLAIDNDGEIRPLFFGGLVSVPIFLGLIVGAVVQIRRMKMLSQRPAIKV
jgi:hypothetical protein